MSRYFVTGISTDVGKTVISAILCEALEADYWKPVQAGDLHHTDTDKVRALVSNSKSVFHPSSFDLNTPMSPHAAADIDGITISLKDIVPPKTKNDLVIEGAGGILVPLNDKDTISDLMQKGDKVILVSRHYLGSINHTLLSLEHLKNKGMDVSIIFSGDEHPTTEDIIKKMGGVNIIGRVDEEPYFDKNVVKEYAERFKENLK